MGLLIHSINTHEYTCICMYLALNKMASKVELKNLTIIVTLNMVVVTILTFIGSPNRKSLKQTVCCQQIVTIATNVQEGLPLDMTSISFSRYKDNSGRIFLYVPLVSFTHSVAK